ncbi:hypothetical protein A7U43_03345 [Mycobacterium adipatum]|uniref:Uncharacterized protein n=1 Tax=Mycobacterium adipatum TaxID=1682113 RepID=A0A172UH79_9MYCO|nr:hypothetical protein A7U43_03345 [Mycobacterium adipatum]
MPTFVRYAVSAGPGAQSDLQLLPYFLVHIGSDGRGNLKRRRQPVADRCRQAAGVYAAVNVDLQRIARCKRDGPLPFEYLVLHGTVAGHTCLSFEAIDPQWLARGFK